VHSPFSVPISYEKEGGIEKDVLKKKSRPLLLLFISFYVKKRRKKGPFRLIFFHPPFRS